MLEHFWDLMLSCKRKNVIWKMRPTQQFGSSLSICYTADVARI